MEEGRTRGLRPSEALTRADRRGSRWPARRSCSAPCWAATTTGWTRALGSSQSLSLPNTVLNTIVAQAIDSLADQLESELQKGADLESALPPILRRSYAANKQIIFGGDNYSSGWHSEAQRRGLLNLSATPDALPYLVADDTVSLFSDYGVLSERELHSRYEVFLEQYVTKLNIE